MKLSRLFRKRPEHALRETGVSYIYMPLKQSVYRATGASDNRCTSMGDNSSWVASARLRERERTWSCQRTWWAQSQQNNIILDSNSWLIRSSAHNVAWQIGMRRNIEHMQIRAISMQSTSSFMCIQTRGSTRTTWDPNQQRNHSSVSPKTHNLIIFAYIFYKLVFQILVKSLTQKLHSSDWFTRTQNLWLSVSQTKSTSSQHFTERNTNRIRV